MALPVVRYGSNEDALPDIRGVSEQQEVGSPTAYAK